VKPFVIAPEAAEDLSDIWDYIAEDSLDAADRFLDKLHAQIAALSENPHASDMTVIPL
jgi:plasmid stabilization system protein ParE